MRTEPDIHRREITHALNDLYGLRVQAICFVPTDWSGYNYRVNCDDGSRYFLKLFDPTEQKMYARSSREFYIPLTHVLYTKGVLRNIPHPIPALDGSLSADVVRFGLLLNNYIDGEIVGLERRQEHITRVLAEQVGRLHAGSSQLQLEKSLVDGFEIVFEDDFYEFIDSSKMRPVTFGQKKLQMLLEETRDKALRFFQRLQLLQRVAQKLHVEHVVCHTDLHGGNLMTNDNNELFILDWENAMFAPPEHDLFIFVGDDDFWGVFFPIYQTQFNRVRLHAPLSEFYFLRRGLEDWMDYIIRIVHGNGGHERDKSDLVEMRECLDGLEYVEETVAQIATHLEALN